MLLPWLSVLFSHAKKNMNDEELNLNLVYAVLAVCAQDGARIPLTVIMAILRRREPSSALDLAEALNVQRNTIAQQLSRLGKLGLVKQTEKAYKNGVRRIFYGVTSEGEDYLKKELNRIKRKSKKRS